MQTDDVPAVCRKRFKRNLVPLVKFFDTRHATTRSCRRASSAYCFRGIAGLERAIAFDRTSALQDGSSYQRDFCSGHCRPEFIRGTWNAEFASWPMMSDAQSSDVASAPSRRPRE
jgi:hypothetical protein